MSEYDNTFMYTHPMVLGYMSIQEVYQNIKYFMFIINLKK